VVGGCRPWVDKRMGKRIIEVPLDAEQVVLVEVDDEDFLSGRGCVGAGRQTW